MAYYTQKEFKQHGFNYLGKISTRASIYYCEKIEIGDSGKIDDFV